MKQEEEQPIGIKAQPGSALARLLEMTRAAKAPVVRSSPARTSFRALRVTGRAGETVPICEREFNTFKPLELFATDTSARPGYGTAIESMFVGCRREFTSPQPVPTWMFGEYILPEERPALEDAAARMGTADEDDTARQAATRLRVANAAASYKWTAWNGGLDITINIVFREDCAWEAVFWGQELR